MTNKFCKECSVEMYKTTSMGQSTWDRKVFCSHACYWKALKGRKLKPSTVKKMSKFWKGKSKSAEWIKKISGENNAMWRGDRVGYHGVHIWIRKQLGKPTKCEHCGINGGESRRYQWANKTGLYKRDVTDWMRLCLSCHRRFDKIPKKNSRVILRGKDIKLKEYAI